MAHFKPRKLATVLIVEGNFLIQLELADWLTGLGLTALTADDAAEAIEQLEIHPDIDFLLTGVRLRGSMDGVRLARHVAANWAHVKTVVVSGAFDTELSGLPTGSLFVSKPFWHQDLWRALDRKNHGIRPA